MGALSRSRVVGLGAVLVLGLGPRGEALPDPAPIADTWGVTGTHSKHGAYKGALSIVSNGDGTLSVSETLTFHNGSAPLTWSATGTAKGSEITFKGPSTIGLVGALADEKGKDATKCLHGTIKISDDGKRLTGLWVDDVAKTKAREKGDRTEQDDALLVLVDGDGKDVPKDKKTTDGVVLAADLRETADAPRQMLPVRLERSASATGSKWVLDFPDAKLAVWTDATATTPVKKGEAFDGSGDKTTLYLEGLVPSEPAAQETLRVRLEKDGLPLAADSGKVTVAQSAFMVCGHGHSSTYALESFLSGRKLDAREHPTLVMGKTEGGKPVPWAVFIFETRNGATLALSTPNSVVSYDGHSNFGLGFAFGVTGRGFKTLHEFMLISDPQVAVNWEYLRDHQDHPDLMFDESEYGDDSTTGEFSDPVAVRRAIKGAHGVYDNMRTVRFPLAGGEGDRLHLIRGTERWQDSHNAIDGSRIVLKSGAPDMPAKRWKKLMLNSCYSGPYYFESFGGHGTLYFTLEESSSSATSAEFIAGCIDGKPDEDVLKAVNAEENIWDFNVFGQ